MPESPLTLPRGRGAVAASILAVLLIGGYFASAVPSGSPVPAEFFVNAVILVLVFWFPAMRFGSARDVLAAWRSLIPWLLAWTLVWDLASSGVVGARSIFQEWWLVYPSGVVTLYLLLMLHGFLVNRFSAGPGDD